ncbi:S1 family peptidase [Streptomyces sp.]|uniref:S1 family peptidase n=1 Tax=Streptomyces sp. TaxID=1931 RepID=UPI002D7701FE|nr:S1 family peptidase [Streptomyces sp.]HET6357961.1 S1 family peptidase [Streptomyces sp.]
MKHSHVKRTRGKRIAVAVATGVALSATLTTYFAGASTPSKTRPSDTSPTAGSSQMLGAMQRDLGLTRKEAQTRLVQEADAQRKVQTVRRASGASWAGAWFDAKKGRLAVAVTSLTAARQAKSLGAVPKLVSRSQAELRGVVDQLQRGAAGTPPSAVTGWGMDPRTNSVVITVTRGQSKTAPFLTRARALNPSVRVAETSGVQRQQAGEVRGGDRWTLGNGGVCSIGFAATGANGSSHFLTAGHCTLGGQAAFGLDGSQIGVSNGSIKGIEGDFGKVDVTNADSRLTSTINAYGQGPNVTVSGAGEALVGQSVCRSGVATGFRCGTVLVVDRTVNVDGAPVGGLTETNACAAAGDSGGAYVSGTTAVGTHVSGLAEGCNAAEPDSHFQPVQEALTRFGLTLVTGEENASGTTTPAR